jgi:ATP-dependent DNA helicase RecG
MNLEDLLRTETDRIEWKRSPQDSDGLFRAACALANDLGASACPGYVVVGIEKDGTVSGVDPARLDQIQQDIANRLHSTKIQPTPSFDLTVLDVDTDLSLVLITVHPYPVPPVVTVEGIAWVRQGSSTRRATEADWQRLRERRPDRNQPFDLRAMADAGLEDLDTRRLRDLYDAARLGDLDAETFPPFEQWLSQRQMVRLVGGQWRPNPAAILLHGVSPQSWFPGAMIEFVRYKGTDVDCEVATRKTIVGTLADQLDAVWAQLSAHLESAPVRPGPSTDIREPYLPRYPLDALKELARNLVQHRLYEGTHAPGRIEWYADRIEFSNPGGPYGRASEGELGEHTDYRNPIVTARLVELGYVQQLGRGIRRVRLQLERNGNPPLVAEVDGFTRVIVRGRP